MTRPNRYRTGTRRQIKASNISPQSGTASGPYLPPAWCLLVWPPAADVRRSAMHQTVEYVKEREMGGCSVCIFFVFVQHRVVLRRNLMAKSDIAACRCRLQSTPYRMRRAKQGKDDNERGDGVREDDADGAQYVSPDHPPVDGSAGLRAALRKKHGLYEHRQQQHKLGGEIVQRDKRKERRTGTATLCRGSVAFGVDKYHAASHRSRTQQVKLRLVT